MVSPIRYSLPATSFGRHDVDTSAFAIELYLPVDECKQREIPTLPHSGARMKLVADLADEDVAGDDALAAESFHATPLGVGITTIAAGTLTLFMCHRGNLNTENLSF